MNLPAGDWLPPRDGHRVWWCEGGDPHGTPVLLVHGGPGGASRADPLRWLDGLAVRWIAIDQRGCGRSQPLGDISANDLPGLLSDMEALRAQLGLAHWALLAGSWGVRVALAYAAAWPGRVRGLFARSPFLGTPAETARYIAAWPAWLGPAGGQWLGAERAAAVQALFETATLALSPATTGVPRAWEIGNDGRVAAAWSAYDDAQSLPGGIAASGARCEPGALKAPTPAQALSWRVHAHYAASGWGGGWPVDAPLPPVAGPLAVVWGGADATCDPATARHLAAAWPQADAREVAGGGHRMGDPRMAPALHAAARDWVARLSA